MKEHPNFYENLKEAQMRLNATIVCYDGEPYIVHTISNHKDDGIFRIYLLPPEYGNTNETVGKPYPDVNSYLYAHPDNREKLGLYLDGWMQENPTVPMIRKHLSSPKFNKFRPFPLGMCNKGKDCVYLERQPLRRTEQGLARGAMQESIISLSPNNRDKGRYGGIINMQTKEFVDTVKGNYPSAAEVVANLKDPNIGNNAVGFHRYFALVRGPIGMLFLAYKADIIGVLPDASLSRVRLGREFSHLKEVTAELGVFGSIEI